MAFHASIQAWASAARPSGVSAPPAGADPFQLSIHFCASFALASALDAPPAGLGLEEPEEEEESPPRVALAAKRPPRATTAASAPPEDALESDFFLEDFFLDDFEDGADLEEAALGEGAVLPPPLAGLRLQPGDLGAVEAGLGGALGLHLLVEGGRRPGRRLGRW